MIRHRTPLERMQLLNSLTANPPSSVMNASSRLTKQLVQRYLAFLVEEPKVICKETADAIMDRLHTVPSTPDRH
ncbi:hypothetical protein WJX73_002836 [Symbiochloris irregularis]|uniref:Uncharacterized protein n=1 Tax=Symbiochloris irregularis TaxID=706552 RepID=A0AAW1NTF4_9CHLO